MNRRRVKLTSVSARACALGGLLALGFWPSHGWAGELQKLLEGSKAYAALPANWPQEDAVGAGMRCSWYNPGRPRNYDLQCTRLSDRLLAALVAPERHPEHRWRGVRTAPKAAGD